MTRWRCCLRIWDMSVQKHDTLSTRNRFTDPVTGHHRLIWTIVCQHPFSDLITQRRHNHTHSTCCQSGYLCSFQGYEQVRLGKKKTSAEARGGPGSFQPAEVFFCQKHCLNRVNWIQNSIESWSLSFQHKYRQGFAKIHMVEIPDCRVILSYLIHVGVLWDANPS